MFTTSLSKSIRPHLHAGEQLRASVMAQASGANRQLLARALGPANVALRADEATAAAHAAASRAGAEIGVALERRMVLVATDQRLLIFRQRGAFLPKAAELLGAVNRHDVESFDVQARGTTKQVTFRAAGTTVTVETARGQDPEAIGRALGTA